MATILYCIHTQGERPAIQSETVLQTTASWDGILYEEYPAGRPQLSVVKVTIAPHTALNWHSHPVPSAGYVISGELTLEKKDATKKHFKAGDAIAETVDTLHRGMSGDEPTVLIVFYAGSPKLPLVRSQ
jgi:quercetin dioxygenase-like cupin family protein